MQRTARGFSRLGCDLALDPLDVSCLVADRRLNVTETASLINELFFFITTPPVLANIRAASSSNANSRSLKRPLELGTTAEQPKQPRINAITHTQHLANVPGPPQSSPSVGKGPQGQGEARELCRDYHCACALSLCLLSVSTHYRRS